MSDTPDHYDELETRDPELRAHAQSEALVEQIINAQDNAPGFAETLEKIDPHTVRGPDGLRGLPILRRADLIERQKKSFEERDPFGGLTAVKSSQLARIFVTAGPLHHPMAARPDYWRTARALFAAGLRRRDIVCSTFSIDAAPVAAMFDAGLMALGCPIVPPGVDALKPAACVGASADVKKFLSGAKDVRCAVVLADEGKPPKASGVDVKQCYATPELGVIAYQSAGGEGLIVDEWVIVEIVKPGAGDPVAAGETGEVVVTSLNPDYPLIRFATGDLSAILPGHSPCGRTNMRLKGLLGRV